MLSVPLIPGRGLSGSFLAQRSISSLRDAAGPVAVCPLCGDKLPQLLSLTLFEIYVWRLVGMVVEFES